MAPFSHELPCVMLLPMSLRESGVGPKLSSSQFFRTTVIKGFVMILTISYSETKREQHSNILNSKGLRVQ
jgi:hypothetical protein